MGREVRSCTLDSGGREDKNSAVSRMRGSENVLHFETVFQNDFMDFSRNFIKSVWSGTLDWCPDRHHASGPSAVLALSDEDLGLCSGAVSQGCV